MQILLAAPGTGKTTKIKSIIDTDYAEASNILVLSFTNATINDLTNSFREYKNVRCHTLHQYALIINHLPKNHVLCDYEIRLLERVSSKIEIGFNTICEILHCMTFEMMISSSIEFINQNPAYAEEKVGEIDLLVVDEFQDFNQIERDLVFLLSRYSHNTIVLGDDDQSIYSFKNADPEALIGLFRDESTKKLHHDHICYRCPDPIVDSCSILINRNDIRVSKEWNKSNKEGELVALQANGQAKVCTFIGDQIDAIKAKGEDETFLILSHVRIASNAIIAALIERGIDIVNFWQNTLDRDDYILIWWLRAIYGSHKLLNLVFLTSEFNQFSNKLILKFQEYFHDTSNYNQLVDLIISYKPFHSFREHIIKPPSLEELLDQFDEFRKFEEYLEKEDIRNSVDELMKNINIPMRFDDSKVNIMSIHKSKGLQADNVFILGLTEGLLPNRSLGIDTLEAQRRLLYVGMTRAQKRLWLISNVYWNSRDILGSLADKKQFKFSGKDHMYGKISSFIGEMGLPVYKL